MSSRYKEIATGSRCIVKDERGEPWFRALGLGKAFGYVTNNFGQVLEDRTEINDRSKMLVTESGTYTQAWYVNEFGISEPKIRYAAVSASTSGDSSGQYLGHSDQSGLQGQ